ncbi:MAG: MATE family efflux transporter [Anaerolineae bacterium]|nr:MATE family efflux transporter [Anaerolineae bacterium]
MLKDKYYTQTLLKIGVPIALQQLLFAAFNLLDTVMMGQMGEQSIAAVGLANQITFVYNLVIFGVTNGAAIFAAQYWGVKDMDGIHRAQRVTILLSALIGMAFSAVALLIPETVLGFYTNDAEVIRLGAQYLRIIGITYLVMGMYMTYITILRSVHIVKMPTAISVVGLLFNMLVNYLLIFGKFGFPQLGVRGAAIGTLVVRLGQFAVLLLIVYWKKLPAAVNLFQPMARDAGFLARFFKTTAPVLVNETLWSLAITTINSIYAHISTEAVAAVNITGTVEQFVFVIGIGMANATGIMVGNEIGAGREHNAKTYARWSILISAGLALLLGAVIFFSAPFIIRIYNVSEQTRFFAVRLMRVMGMILWSRTMMANFVVGILRPGGDTRFTLVVDGLVVWVVGVSMAYLGANVLHLPVYWVYLMVASEEIVKNFMCYLRFRSGKWITNLTRAETSLELAPE